jgi:hypothetical protein
MCDNKLKPAYSHVSIGIRTNNDPQYVYAYILCIRHMHAYMNTHIHTSMNTHIDTLMNTNIH